MGALFGLLFPIGATLIRIADSDLPLGLSSIVFVQTTDSLLWIIDTAPLFLSLFASFAGRRQDALQEVIAQLRLREDELTGVQAMLAQRVEQRTQALSAANQNAERRAGQLQAIAETAHTVISIQDMDRLLPLLTQVISTRFGFYHVGIFIIDELGQYAILRAANSEGGLRMFQRGHRLKVGEQGVVGFAAHRGRARIALDVGADPVFFDNPDLPATRSEMALPLKSGNQIIGVLDIQSTEVNAFTEDDISTLSILADQVTIAIQNAILHEQAQNAAREAEMASSQLTGHAWKGYAEAIKARGYRYDGIRSEPLKAANRYSAGSDALLMPVRLRGRTIGNLKLRASNASRQWTEDELAMIEATAERVALALEGARLLQGAQKRAAREAFLSDVAAKLGATFQLDSILRDTVEELGRMLKDSTVSFQLAANSNGRRSPGEDSE
jgi:GAF domain-containing protein